MPCQSCLTPQSHTRLIMSILLPTVAECQPFIFAPLLFGRPTGAGTANRTRQAAPIGHPMPRGFDMAIFLQMVDFIRVIATCNVVASRAGAWPGHRREGSSLSITRVGEPFSLTPTCRAEAQRRRRERAGVRGRARNLLIANLTNHFGMPGRPNGPSFLRPAHRAGKPPPEVQQPVGPR